jgi:ubiquinone/menaquinone biosynthesis C-methylase UbiE
MGDASQQLKLTRLQRAFRRLYVWATLRLYDQFAWAYEVVAWLVSLGHWDAWRKQVLDWISGERPAESLRILEIGFGTGELLIEAARRGLDALGADPSVSMHRVAGRRARRSGVALRRVVAVSQALPFAGGTFDAMVSTFPADYIADPATLQEAARMLRDPRGGQPGGRFVITGIGTRILASRPSPEVGGSRTEAVALRLLGGLLSLIFGDGTEDSVALYTRFAEQAGFAVTIVEGSGAVRVPVLVLEKVGSSEDGGEP